MATTISIEGNAKLDRLMLSNPDMTKKVTAIIRKVIKQARAEVAQRAQTAIPNDPRQATRAVRSSVYKALLGGQVNILNPRHAAGGGGSYQPTRTLRPGQRGGNRLPRSQRTEQMDAYMGADRAFVLRWLETGTNARTSRYGNRGAIAARRWFGNASYAALDKASEEFGQLLDALIAKEMNNQ